MSERTKEREKRKNIQMIVDSSLNEKEIQKNDG